MVRIRRVSPSKKTAMKKEDLREEKHSVHVTTFITSFIYKDVHGDLSPIRSNKSEMFLIAK